MDIGEITFAKLVRPERALARWWPWLYRLMQVLAIRRICKQFNLDYEEVETKWRLNGEPDLTDKNNRAFFCIMILDVKEG